MNIFKVEVVKIESVNPHPHADRLDIASFTGMLKLVRDRYLLRKDGTELH